MYAVPRKRRSQARPSDESGGESRDHVCDRRAVTTYKNKLGEQWAESPTSRMPGPDCLGRARIPHFSACTSRLCAAHLSASWWASSYSHKLPAAFTRPLPSRPRGYKPSPYAHAPLEPRPIPLAPHRPPPLALKHARALTLALITLRSSTPTTAMRLVPRIIHCPNNRE